MLRGAASLTRFFRSGVSWAWVISYLPSPGVPSPSTRLKRDSFSTSIKNYSSALPVSTKITGRTWPTKPGVPKSSRITAPSPIGIKKRGQEGDGQPQRGDLAAGQSLLVRNNGVSNVSPQVALGNGRLDRKSVV